MGRSRFKLPQFSQLFWFSSSKEARILQRKHNGRMIFGCQAFNNVSEDVRTPLPAKKSRVKPENRICSSPTNRKGSHACPHLSATDKLSKQSQSSNPACRLDKAPKIIPEGGILAPENHGIFGTPMRHARRASNKSDEGPRVKAKRSLSFSCDSSYMKPQAAGCLENECGPGTTSAAQPNFDTPIDDWAKDNAWNVLATVKNKIIRKRVVLRKMRSYKRIDTPPLNDAFDASKVNEQKAGHCTRVDSASSERRAASSVCSYRLSTSSLDTGQDVEHCAWDREPASFASDCSFLQRSFGKQAAFPGSLISHTGESSALHRKDSSTCRAVEKHRLCERLDGENASVDVKLEFRSVVPKLANGSRRKGIPCKWTIRRKGRLLSKSPKMVDGLGDRFPAFSKDYRDRPSDPESSSKQWISSTSSNIIQRRDCNTVLLEDSTSSVFYSSRPLERTTTKISALRNCYREENQDPLPVEATVSSVSLTNNERAAACRKAQCWKWSYSTEAQSRAQSRIVPSKVKKVRKVKESIAVVKRSYNPYRDFQSSMLEMIISKKIQEPAKLKELLECYTALNSPSYRELIMAAFENVCHHMLFSKASAQSTSPPSHFSACLEKDTKHSRLDSHEKTEFF